MEEPSEERLELVHPRLRGELAGRNYPKGSTGGSSPLTRGTRKDKINARRRERFIPAYAGNSTADKSIRRPPPVHPRLRGELQLVLVRLQPAVGSSPLTRGTQSAL